MSDTFQHQLTKALRDPSLRVAPLVADGQTYWVKKEETLNLRYRLQKGNPHHAFEADRAAFLLLANNGVPVPRIIAEGAGYFVMEDCGTPLSQLLGDPTTPKAEKIAAFTAAGRMLAETHTKRLSHGRPSIKDMCWGNGQLTFLDFERYSPARNTLKGHMQDLIIFVHSCFVFSQQNSPMIDAALDAYRSADQLGIWPKAQTWCRRMRWVNWVTKPIQWRKPGRGREFKVIPLTLEAFGVI